MCSVPPFLVDKIQSSNLETSSQIRMVIALVRHANDMCVVFVQLLGHVLSLVDVGCPPDGFDPATPWEPTSQLVLCTVEDPQRLCLSSSLFRSWSLMSHL